MAKKMWSKVVQDGLYMMQNRHKYCYIYGAKGQYLNSYAQIDALMAAEPKYFARYSAAEKEQIKRNSIKKYAFDCSGFTAHCTGDKGYSTAQFNNSHDKTAHLEKGPAGSLLYTTYGGQGRHIGLDMGFGFVLDMAYESTDANIAAHKDSVRLYKRTDNFIPWEWSAQSNAVDYTGAANY